MDLLYWTLNMSDQCIPPDLYMQCLPKENLDSVQSQRISL